jgi:hypothetical protein
MLLKRGVFDGARVLAPRTVEFMTADHLGQIAEAPTTSPALGTRGVSGWPSRRA